MAQEQYTFVPVEQAVPEAAPEYSFVPIAQVAPEVTPTTAPPTPIAAPPVTPALEKDKYEFAPISELTKGFTGGVLNAIPATFSNVGLRQNALSCQKDLNEFNTLKDIETGNITDLKQLPLVGPDVKVGQNIIPRQYFNASPERREQLRTQAADKLIKDENFVKDSLAAVQAYQEDAKKYQGKTQNLTDINSASSFANWLSYNVGSGAAQLAPMMLAAAATGGTGVFAISSAMGLSEAVGNRMQFLQDKIKDLPPEQQAKVVADYLNKSNDVDMAVAVVSGALDVVLGPTATLLKAQAKRIVAQETRKEMIKHAVKEIPKQVGEEFITGGAQEAAQIGGENAMGEQYLFTPANAKRVFNAAAAEAAGALGGGAANVGIAAVKGAPAAPVETEPTAEDIAKQKGFLVKSKKDRIEELATRLEEDMGYKPHQALATATDRVNKEMGIVAPKTESNAPQKPNYQGLPISDEKIKNWPDALLQSTLEHQNKKPDETKHTLLIQQVEAEIERRKAEPNARSPIIESGGTSATTPSGSVTPSTTGGTETPAGNGVVSTQPNVGEPNVGEGQASTAVADQTAKRNELLSKDNMFMDEEPKKEPAPPAPPITDVDVSNILDYLEKRDELIKQLDAAGEESSVLLDKITDLDSVRAESVLGADGKPLVHDENGKYDSDKKYEARETLEAERNKLEVKYDDIVKQLDELDAARAAARTAIKTKGEPSVTETPETKQATQEEQTAPDTESDIVDETDAEANAAAATENEATSAATPHQA